MAGHNIAAADHASVKGVDGLAVHVPGDVDSNGVLVVPALAQHVGQGRSSLLKKSGKDV